MIKTSLLIKNYTRHCVFLAVQQLLITEYTVTLIIKLHYKTKIKHKLVVKKNNNLNKTDQIKSKIKGTLIRIKLGKIKIP